VHAQKLTHCGKRSSPQAHAARKKKHCSVMSWYRRTLRS